MAEDAAELARVRRLVHSLVCRDRLSPELAADRLASSYLVQRSLADVQADLDAYSCPSCASRAAAQAAPEAGPERERPVHHPAVGAGWLTGMIGRG